MLYPKVLRLLSMLIIVSLLAGALVPTALLAQTAADEPPPQGIRFDAPPYAIDGPYAVGVRYFTIPAESETDRELVASVWYPALNPDGETGQMVYEQQFAPGNIPPFSLLGHALLDAEPDASGGPYPLIVYSHAHWSMAQELPYLTEHLASRGFVVISADHEDDWSTAFGPKPWTTEFQRPDEVRRQIDFAAELSAPDGPLADLISTDKVGVTGFSFGGKTAMAAGGARLNLAEYGEWCDATKVDDQFIQTDCIDVVPFADDLADLAGLAETPDGLWPDWGDDRVAAIAPLAPSVHVFDVTGIRAVDVPTLLVIGGNDGNVGPAYRELDPYSLIGANRKAEVVLAGADHLALWSHCASSPSIVAIGFPGFCNDAVWDNQRTNDLVNHFVTAFFQAELTDDAEAAVALATDQVSFPGVEYREMGYGTAPDPAPPHGIRFDAPAYAIDGPYAVGVSYFTIPAESETDRELTASVWYPALNPNGDSRVMVYAQQFQPGELPPFSVLGHALIDAKPDLSGGPYPLVVYSHAHWSMAQEVPYFAEHLASRGFVVMAADHEDNWSTAFGPMPYEAAIRRPQEVTRQIDFAEMLSADDGDLPGLIATEKVGVAGWSMGALTAMEVAGARKDLVTLRAWCAADPLNVEALTDACVDILDYEAEMADFAGLDEIPAGLWPSTKDERIAAVVPMSGPTPQLGSDGMAYVDVPILFFHGGGEAETDPSVLMGNPFESVSSPRKAEVALDQGDHLLFFSSCADSPSIVEIGFPMFCTDPVWDMDRAHDLINHFATAFLLAELTGDEEAAAALSGDQVNFPGITYQEVGYTP